MSTAALHNGTAMRAMDLIRLLRPKQWSKNLLVFAALLFTAGYSHTDQLLRALIAFAAMCAASSAIYILNDIRDRERDRNHPTKQNRPLASGAIQPPVAIALGIVLLAIALGIGYWLNPASLGILAAYLALQVLYNFGLKSIAVTDVFLIGTGFVLRAALGAAALDVKISGWLLFCTGALALMLGFAKRRHEFIAQGENRTASRESLGHYSQASLDALVIMFACGAALCYGVYSIESTTAKDHPALILTSPFVFYGISRYVLIVFNRDEGGEPENLLFRDKHIWLCIIFFTIAAVLAMSGLKLGLIGG